MYAEVALLLEEAADGAGDAADAQLQAGPVGDAVDDVAGYLNLGLAGLGPAELADGLLGLDHPGHLVGRDDRALAVDVGHLLIDLDYHGVVVVEHIPAHGRGAEGNHAVLVRLGAGGEEHVAAVGDGAVAGGLGEVYRLIREVRAVAHEGPLHGAVEEALDVQVAVVLRQAQLVGLEARAVIELHILQILQGVVGQRVEELIGHARGDAGAERVAALYLAHRLVHADELRCVLFSPVRAYPSYCLS